MIFDVYTDPKAENDLHELAAYIAGKNMQSGQRFLAAAKETVESLSQTPNRGASLHAARSKLDNVRWIPIRDFFEYMMFYRVRESQQRVDILRILHGSRHLLNALLAAG